MKWQQEDSLKQKIERKKNRPKRNGCVEIESAEPKQEALQLGESEGSEGRGEGGVHFAKDFCSFFGS
jgi:hypothetical protein